MVHDRSEIGRAAALFKALAHPGRLEVACRLAESGPKTQKQLIDELGWPQSTMARHLAPLRDLGLVHGDRRGTEVLLRVRSRLLRSLVRSVCDWLQDEAATGGRPSRSRRPGRRGKRSEARA